MSSTAAIDFINKVGENPQLYEQMHQVMGDFNQAQLGDSVEQQVVKIGHNNGFDFSVEEFKDVFNHIRDQQLNATGEELTDTQLDGVDGGGYGYSGSLELTPDTFPTPHSITNPSQIPLFAYGRINRNAVHKIFHP